MKNINFSYTKSLCNFVASMKFLAALTALFLFASCQSSLKQRGLTPEAFNKKMKEGNAVVVDVRTPAEFGAGAISGAVNIDVEAADFDQNIEALDKSKTYLLYCQKGGRSDNAMQKMLNAGFKNVYGLNGGLNAWMTAGQSLGNSPQQTESKDSAVATTPTQKPDFKTAIYGDKLVMVDFNATWCGPCRKMQPFVDIINEERSSEVWVYGIDTDENVQLAQEYQIMNLPTVMFIKKGSVLYRQEGYHDQQTLNELVTKFK